MKIIARAVLRKCTSVILVSAVGLLTGCLYAGDPGHIQFDPNEARSPGSSMEGVQVELTRHSTSCDSTESQGLIVEVGPWVEYPAETVSALKANCSLTPSPGIEVHVEDRAVVFDFSNVEEPGRFPDGEFEGYILEMVRTADAPVLVVAMVDWQISTLDISQDDLSFDEDRLEVNLAGRDFSSDSLLSIQLYLAEVSDPADADSSDQM